MRILHNPATIFDPVTWKPKIDAKQAAYDDLETTTSLKVTLPCVNQEFEDTGKLMGDDYWPCGAKATHLLMEWSKV